MKLLTSLPHFCRRWWKQGDQKTHKTMSYSKKSFSQATSHQWLWTERGVAVKPWSVEYWVMRTLYIRLRVNGGGTLGDLCSVSGIKLWNRWENMRICEEMWYFVRIWESLWESMRILEKILGDDESVYKTQSQWRGKCWKICTLWEG